MRSQSAESFALSNQFFSRLKSMDVRYTVLIILLSYLILGFTLLGFNRSPLQAIVTTLSTAAFEVFLARIFKKKWIFPLSALITSISLSILLNYSQNYWMLFIPVYLAIGSKYFFTFNGKHVFNPAQIAVTLSLLLSGELITAAPAYQWNGIESMGVFIATLGIFLLLPKINRHWLVLSFLFFFTFNTYLRAMIMKHHLPFETLFLGTLTSPAFFLFTFFMITDPATSPKTKRYQILAGFGIAAIDLLYHLKQSYFTFFYAASTIQFGILLFKHSEQMVRTRAFLTYIKERFYTSGYYKKFLFLIGLFLLGKSAYSFFIVPYTDLSQINLKFESLSSKQTGISPPMGDALKRVDPRVQHLAKWLISIGDSAAVADVNNDGLMDIYFSFPLKDDENRNSLYLNEGSFQFKRVELPMKEQSKQIEKYGLPSSGTFVDYDNDGDKDLFITYAFGQSYLLKNLLQETKELKFIDVTKKSKLAFYTNSNVANFFDYNKDGKLDLLLAYVWPTYLPGYPENNKQKLNLFNLPQPEYDGDERMFNFMHASWHQATNGGVNKLLVQNEKGEFIEQDAQEINMTETKWTLAVGTADFNQDGWVDLYMANDFGADDLYYNNQGRGFTNIKGKMFGSIGKDTYKGMNATIADFDNNGVSDVYISNVHHAYQAEGSLLWMFNKDEFYPTEMATAYGVLNESRFGWGAAAGDLNLDGFEDLVQANGMVDDTIDKKWDKCPDYWYVNEKIARSAPSFHRYVNKWGDIRGFCIYGKEKNRVYINQGNLSHNKFIDVADHVGLAEVTNSRGVAIADFDNDGRLDLTITHMFSAPSLYKNQLHPQPNWIGLEIESLAKECNREAIGSRVEVSYSLAGKKHYQMKEKVVVNGFNAQSENRLIFGLGKYQGPIDITVNWCLNEKRNYKITEINQYIKLTYE